MTFAKMMNNIKSVAGLEPEARANPWRGHPHPEFCRDDNTSQCYHLLPAFDTELHSRRSAVTTKHLCVAFNGPLSVDATLKGAGAVMFVRKSGARRFGRRLHQVRRKRQQKLLFGRGFVLRLAWL
jgi:hypothetical protein